MVGCGHIRRWQLKVEWACTRGAVATAEKDNRANIGDLRSWHAHQEVRARLAEESCVSPGEWICWISRKPVHDQRTGKFFSAVSALVGPDHPTPLRRTSEVDQETTHVAPPLWVGSHGDGVACGWIQRHCHRLSTTRGHYLWVCGNPGVISQIKGMVMGHRQGVGSEACFHFSLSRSGPREAGGTPGSPTSPMPPRTEPEVTSSGTSEQELESEALLPFT